MKGYEFLEKIEKREIKKGTKFRIKHFNKEFIYEGGDTLKFINTNKEDDDVKACWFINTEVEVIEEKKEIEELENEVIQDDWVPYAILHHNKINELVRAVNKLNKESEW